MYGLKCVLSEIYTREEHDIVMNVGLTADPRFIQILLLRTELTSCKYQIGLQVILL